MKKLISIFILIIHIIIIQAQDPPRLNKSIWNIHQTSVSDGILKRSYNHSIGEKSLSFSFGEYEIDILTIVSIEPFDMKAIELKEQITKWAQNNFNGNESWGASYRSSSGMLVTIIIFELNELKLILEKEDYRISYYGKFFQYAK